LCRGLKVFAGGPPVRSSSRDGRTGESARRRRRGRAENEGDEQGPRAFVAGNAGGRLPAISSRTGSAKKISRPPGVLSRPGRRGQQGRPTSRGSAKQASFSFSTRRSTSLIAGLKQTGRTQLPASPRAGASGPGRNRNHGLSRLARNRGKQSREKTSEDLPLPDGPGHHDDRLAPRRRRRARCTGVPRRPWKDVSVLPQGTVSRPR